MMNSDLAKEIEKILGNHYPEYTKASACKKCVKQILSVIQKEKVKAFNKIRTELEPDLFGHDWERLNTVLEFLESEGKY